MAGNLDYYSHSDKTAASVPAPNPAIHIIHETPTSTSHDPNTDTYRNPDPYHNPPQNTICATQERSPSHPDPNQNSTPQHHAENPFSDGLQVDPSGAYPIPTTHSPSCTTQKLYLYSQDAGVEEKQARANDGAGLIVCKSQGRKWKWRRGCGIMKRERICGMKRRKFFVVLGVLGFVVLCAAVAAGVAGYFVQRNKDLRNGDDGDDDSDAITSGTHGMAALPCKPSNQKPQTYFSAIPRRISNPYISPSGAHFNITCRRGLPPKDTRQAGPIANLGLFIEYNITACMQRCAADERCGGVTYGANLTQMVQEKHPGGNCLLKNATWVGEKGVKRETWFASAVRID